MLHYRRCACLHADVTMMSCDSVQYGCAQTVALTFDDAPDPTNTARVLDALRDAGVKATFFVNTHNQARRPPMPPALKGSARELAGGWRGVSQRGHMFETSIMSSWAIHPQEYDR